MNSEELLEDVTAEAADIIEKLQQATERINLLLSGETGEVPVDEVHELFRYIHTLKGLCQMGGFVDLHKIIHATEDLIHAVRQGTRPLTLDDLLAVEDAVTSCEQILSKSHAQEPALTSPSPPESANISKFFERSEGLFAVTAPPGSYASLADLESSEAVDALRRSCDILLIRFAPEGCLIVFASELDSTILEALLGMEAHALPKTPDLFSRLPAPWNTLSLSTAADESAAPAAPPVAAPPELPKPEPSQAPREPQVAAEDFDSENLGQPPPNVGDLDAEMVTDFITNAGELLDALSQSILDLEANPDSTEAIESIFRTAHTIKGTAGMFGFRAIEKLTHVMENQFDRVRKGQLVATPPVVDAILFGFDRVRGMFAALQKGQSPEMPINDALARLHGAETGVPPPKAVEKPAGCPAHVEAAPAHPAPDAEKKDNADGKGKHDSSAGTIRVDLRRLDSLVNLVGELVIDRTRFLQIEEELRSQSMDSDLVHTMSEAVLLFGRHMNEVQNIIMKIRMVPIGNAFFKFNRVVRDLARECNKEIDLHIQGGEAELDKTLVEEVGDPLIHLIRNAVDHGIESPDVRAGKGKPRKGNIHLSAQQDGNMIVIQVRDDGKGLQVDRIREKAIKQGLIKETDPLSEKEIFNLIFEPGFSTAEQVTKISGRGVGMDVVKKSIVKLKGVIDLDSAVDKGTTITIKLPLTLAIIPSLMVETAGESYALPLVNVVESIRISPEEIQRIGNSDFVRLRNRALPLFRLTDLFGLHEIETRLWYRGFSAGTKWVRKRMTGDEGDETQLTPTLSSPLASRRNRPRVIFVVVGVGEKRMGIVVDQLLGQQEIVIKSLGPLMSRPDGIAGACVLGNGRVALVIDVGEIIEAVPRGGAGTAHPFIQSKERVDERPA